MIALGYVMQAIIREEVCAGRATHQYAKEENTEQSAQQVRIVNAQSAKIKQKMRSTFKQGRVCGLAVLDSI